MAIGARFMAEERARRVSGETGEKERRREAREPARDLCEIEMDSSGYAVTCMVHNLSESGALIETSDRSVPDRFILTNHFRSERVVCRVAWRKDKLLGVRFVTRPRRLR